MIEETFVRFLLSLAVGALVGMERQKRAKGEVAFGFRTFMLASLLGSLSVHFSLLLGSFIPFYTSFAVTCILTILAYLKDKTIGLTTEIAFILTFLLGVFIYLEKSPFYISLSLAILLTFFLASKEILHTFSKHLTRKEIWSAAFFAVLSFVVLPILPNKPLDPFQALNPFQIWLSIILVLSISFMAYILMKIFGAKKGMMISGILGGMVSSVALTMEMVSKVKKDRIFHSAIFSILLASSTMFLRIFFLSSLFNLNLASKIFVPLASLAIFGYLCSFSFLKKTAKEKPKVELASPLNLKVALKFGILFMLAMILINCLKIYFGEKVTYPIALITGFVEVDAVTISLSTLALSSISLEVAAKGIIIAALSNTLFKWLLTYFFGNKEIASQVGKVFFLKMLLGIFLIFSI
ncbi:MAG: DUF4010 domain-containing protein [Candidatus Aenigmatarchaeota archaeon]